MWLVLLNMLLVFVLSCILLINIDYRMNDVLETYINIEAKRIVSHVVNKSLKEVDVLKIGEYLDIGDDGITYNVVNINNFKNELTSKIQKNFSAIEHGDFSDYPLFFNYDKKKYRHIQHGYLCEVNFNSIRKSILFSNVGPNIPIRLIFTGDISVDVDVKVKEYGINNAMIELYAIVVVSNQVTMPFSSKNQNIKLREPLTIDIVKGIVPNYYSVP